MQHLYILQSIATAARPKKRLEIAVEYGLPFTPRRHHPHHPHHAIDPSHPVAAAVTAHEVGTYSPNPCHIPRPNPNPKRQV